MTREDCKAIRAALAEHLKKMPGYVIEVGNASYDMAQVTFKVTVRGTGREAQAAQDRQAQMEWDLYEPPYFQPALKRGDTFRATDGLTHTLDSHTRNGNIVTVADNGRKYRWRREVVLRAMNITAQMASPERKRRKA